MRAKTKTRGPFLGGAILFTIGLSMAIHAYSDDSKTEPREPIPLCREEDGSGAQHFPCYWDGGSNGRGARYILTEPINSIFKR